MKAEKKLGRMMSTYYILQSFIFYVPVLTIFLNYKIKNLFYVSILFAVKSIATWIFEIPTGIIADYISRKISIICGTTLYICSMAIFYFKPEFIFLIVAQLLFGISETLISGADQALFYDNFKYIHKEDAYPNYIANLTFWSNIALFIAFVVGGLVYSYNKRLVFLLTAVFMGLSLFTLAILKEYPYKDQDKQKKKSCKLWLNNIIILKKESKKFWFYLIGCSIVEAIILSIYLYLAPIILEIAGVKAGYFGFIFAVCSILYGMGSKLIKYVKHPQCGLVVTLILIPIIIGLQYWGNIAIITIISIGILRMLWGLFDTIFKTQLHEELSNSEVRATVFSVSNSIINLSSTVMMFVFGWILTNISYQFLILFVVCFFIPILICFLNSKKY